MKSLIKQLITPNCPVAELAEHKAERVCFKIYESPSPFTAFLLKAIRS